MKKTTSAQGANDIRYEIFYPGYISINQKIWDQIDQLDDDFESGLIDDDNYAQQKIKLLSELQNTKLLSELQ